MGSEQELTDPGYWDGIWTSSAAVRQIKPWHPYYGRDGIFMKTMRARLGTLQGLRILEVGAGGDNHRLLALAKWGGADVSAIDYSKVGLKILDETFAANGCRVTSYLDDFVTHDFRERVFDVVVHWGVLEHFADPVPMLAACARCLPATGRLLFSMPNMKAFGARWWRGLSPENWKRHVLHEDDAVLRAGAAAGLKVTDTFYFGFPAVKMAPSERDGVVSKLLTVGQRAINATAFVLPYHRGNELLSNERGFLATRSGC